jgi:small conductance mechanosensitive channel
MRDLIAQINSLDAVWRAHELVAIAHFTHVVVTVAESATLWFSARGTRLRLRRLQSLATLLSSALVFALYFLMFGLILAEFGVSLAAYLASASVVGLAIAFGAQGLVQDVVTGLTLIFSDLIDVGDLVEMSGQTGVVRSVTMRFVELENSLGGTVFVPNRTIGGSAMPCVPRPTTVPTDRPARISSSHATSTCERSPPCPPTASG